MVPLLRHTHTVTVLISGTLKFPLVKYDSEGSATPPLIIIRARCLSRRLKIRVSPQTPPRSPPVEMNFSSSARARDVLALPVCAGPPHYCIFNQQQRPGIILITSASPGIYSSLFHRCSGGAGWAGGENTCEICSFGSGWRYGF